MWPIWVSCGNVGVRSVTVFDKIIAVEIKVITYQDENKLEICIFSNNAVMCDASGTILGKPT